MRVLSILALLALAACSTPSGSDPDVFSPDDPPAENTTPPEAQSESPDDFIRRLYQDHGTPRGPFFTADTTRIRRFCTPALTTLLRNDILAAEAAGEVPTLNGDPLFNAQDTSITNFKILEPTYPKPGRRAEVVVIFRNFDAPQRITFRLEKEAAGWRVADIDWGDGYTLRKVLSDTAGDGN